MSRGNRCIQSRPAFESWLDNWSHSREWPTFQAILRALERRFSADIEFVGNSSQTGVYQAFTFPDDPRFRDRPRAALLAWLGSEQSILQSRFGEKYLRPGLIFGDDPESLEEFTDWHDNDVARNRNVRYVDRSRPECGIVKFCSASGLAGQMHFLLRPEASKLRVPGLLTGTVTEDDKEERRFDDLADQRTLDRLLGRAFLTAAQRTYGKGKVHAGKWALTLGAIEEGMFEPTGMFFFAHSPRRPGYEGVIFYYYGGY